MEEQMEFKTNKFDHEEAKDIEIIIKIFGKK